jgi:hypothetical protein
MNAPQYGVLAIDEGVVCDPDEGTTTQGGWMGAIGIHITVERFAPLGADKRRNEAVRFQVFAGGNEIDEVLERQSLVVFQVDEVRERAVCVAEALRNQPLVTPRELKRVGQVFINDDLSVMALVETCASKRPLDGEPFASNCRVGVDDEQLAPNSEGCKRAQHVLKIDEAPLDEMKRDCDRNFGALSGRDIAAVKQGPGVGARP